MYYQKAGRNEEALRMCQEMIRAEPTNGLHYIGLGNLCARLGRRPEAEAAYRQAVDLAPDRPETHFALGQYYLQSNSNLVAAVRLAQEAVKLAPRAPHYYLLGRVCARTGDRSGALAAIEKA
jgi:superkiller protein 3